MSPRLPSIFKKTALAVAIVSLTGCASTSPNRDSGGIGDTLMRAGAATADASARAWHKTTYLLGFHDEGGTGGQFDAPLRDDMDDLDIALMEPEVFTPGASDEAATADTIDIAAARVDRAIALGATPFEEAGASTDNRVTAERLVTDADPMDIFSDQDEALLGADTTVVATATVAEGSDEAILETVVLDDYMHKVGDSETLWDIAKATTGDATNWHVLADINDLAPNASVYPGQELVIPADMVKPELAAGPTPEAEQEPMLADAGERLSIPTGDDEIATVATEEAPAQESVIVVAAASPVAESPATSVEDDRGFVIEEGETLWDFAKRTTGDATYWQAIAAHNGMDEAAYRSVRPGQKVMVPELLVRPELSGDTVIAEAPAAVTVTEPSGAVDDVAVAELDTNEAVDAGAAVLAGTNGLDTSKSILDETQGQDITIVEAAFRSDTELDLDSAEITADLGEIKIRGTYYPKAIYNDADFSSSLLMRVSPGTTLTVSSVDGAWYQVETERGTGYVHNRDIK